MKKINLGNLIFKYDFIDKALEVICYENLKSPRDIGSFDDMGTERILAKNRGIA